MCASDLVSAGRGWRVYLYGCVFLQKFDLPFHVNHTMDLLLSPLGSHKSMTEMHDHALSILLAILGVYPTLAGDTTHDALFQAVALGLSVFFFW